MHPKNQTTQGVTAVMLGLAALACEGAPRPLEPFPADGSMSLLVILDPDSASQPVLIESIEPHRGWQDLRVDLFLDGVVAASSTLATQVTPEELYPCILFYANEFGFDPRCPTLDVAPPHGARYRLVVSAAGRPTASAEGTVPGDFEIRSASARGEPPGTEGLEASWTRSEGAWRYAVGLRPDSIRGCENRYRTRACMRLWFAATADTAIRTTVPREVVEGGYGAWHVEVFAMERSLYQHLTTGTAGAYFSVPPVQNVEGGYGAVGAWVWRSVKIEP